MVPRRHRRAFALIELALLIVVAAMLTALLLVTGGESRRQARLGEDFAKLRQIGAWTAAYGGDNADQFWSFSWRKGQSLSQYPDLNNAPSDLQAGANQAVDILRRVADREDIAPIVSWIAHTSYGHLTLVDYFKSEAPTLHFVSAGDANRLRWARDPAGFDQGFYQPAPSPGTNAGKRWPYGSSFHMQTGYYDASDPANRISQGGQHSLYFTPSANSLIQRVSSSVEFPSQKVHVHDAAAWHFGKTSHCAFPEMRLPLLFADGAVHVRATAYANVGWQPQTPTSVNPTTYVYEPSGWEPPTPSGLNNQLVFSGRYRWTRAYIAGRDFGGPEACTGQPFCP